MKKTNDLQRIIIAALLALTMLPFSALAVTEDAMESAPEVSFSGYDAEEIPDTEEEQESFLPSFWKNTVKGSPSDVTYYTPWLTDSETERAMELMSAMKAGEASSRDGSREEQAGWFKVGVYPLNPADFAGETFYVTLPCRELNDAELISLISGFEVLGIPFDPGSLNERNCRRFYNDGGTRELSDNERERLDELTRMIIYGILDPEDIRTETECRVLYTDYGPFFLYPYRRMTDHELASFAYQKESVWEVNPDVVRRTAEKFAGSMVRFTTFPDVRNMERDLVPGTNETQGYSVWLEELSSEDRPLSDGQPTGFYVRLLKNPDGTLLESMLTVDYYTFAPSYQTMYSGARKYTREELLDEARKWVNDNLLVSGSMALTGWSVENASGSFRVCAESADHSWYAAVDIYENGAVSRFTLSRDGAAE